MKRKTVSKIGLSLCGVLGIIIMAALFSCQNEKKGEAKTVKFSSKDIWMQEEQIHSRLKDHFEQYRITPSIEVNNSDFNLTNIQLGKHKIKWIDKEDETKIKIDNDLFSLKDKMTLNIVHDAEDEVDFANNWDEIKLWEYNDREYIGIRMRFHICTGIGCGVDLFLIYDV